MRKLILTSIITLIAFSSVSASDRAKLRGRSAWAWASCQTCSPAEPTVLKPATTVAKSEALDALAEVNAERQKRGLPPFKHDPLLTQAAQEAARQRASRGISGHLASDFDCLPAGAHADAAGCGALDDSWGWGTCCTYDNYTHAGAAWVRGSDGRRYMHLFVRNQPAGTIRIVNQSAANCVP